MSFNSKSTIQALGAVILCLNLSGCAWLPWWKGDDSITVNKKTAERTPLDLPDPHPLRPTTVEWIVVTPENINQVWESLRKKNADLVLFAVTDDGYEIMAADMAQIRNYIAQQREVIIRYREYYEPKKETK